MDVWGTDISEAMVAESKSALTNNGLNPDQIFWGDIQDPVTYAHALQTGQFDGLMAMGVMPHVQNDDAVLENTSSLVKPSGSVFIEFRNKLFSLFSLNRLSAEFILDDLLDGVSGELKNLVRKDLEARQKMSMPPFRKSVETTDAPGYDEILSRFHNPFEVVSLFKQHGFSDIKLRWYHYHPAMPYLTDEAPILYRKRQ